MLITVRKINNFKERPRVIKCRNYAKYDPTIFCNDLKKVPWDTVLSLTNVDEAWSLWKYNFAAVCDKHAPLIDKKVRGCNRPFYRYGGILNSIVLTEKLWAAEGAITGKFIVYTAFRINFYCLSLIFHNKYYKRYIFPSRYLAVVPMVIEKLLLKVITPQYSF